MPVLHIRSQALLASAADQLVLFQAVPGCYASQVANSKCSWFLIRLGRQPCLMHWLMDHAWGDTYDNQPHHTA